jgi:quinol-cytochrome oxidoreductase complex cytochrome b subunit
LHSQFIWRIDNNVLIPVVLNELFFYPTPNNFNYFYCVGFLLGLLLCYQFISGVLLACYYIPKLGIAFTSIDYGIRDVAIGWAVSFLHSNGASFFLSFIYIHIIKAICYSSFQTPKHKVWFSGLVLFLFISSTAFLGYVLPWGQMSFWGATVIINFLTVVPYIGSPLAKLLWGGFHVNKATLTRFFTLHFLMPVFISFISILHIILLLQIHSSIPLHSGNIKETIKFHP